MYSIQLVALSDEIFQGVLRERRFESNGMKIGDPIHFTTAISKNVDMIITGDDHFHKLNEVFINSSGNKIKCLDTDEALKLL
ncbi:hypothetical protein [Wukongibacter sp. M2B1]|uniref:hypothetical protein n=1 Tax=Wukongibacter sp. M2B1 TaxID=3088895 RepID=UPI003D7AF03F